MSNSTVIYDCFVAHSKNGNLFESAKKIANHVCTAVTSLLIFLLQRVATVKSMHNSLVLDTLRRRAVDTNRDNSHMVIMNTDNFRNLVFTSQGKEFCVASVARFFKIENPDKIVEN